MTAKSVAALLEQSISRAKAQAAENIHDELIQGTPVQTGKTRASWKVSRGKAEPGHVTKGGSADSPLPAPAFDLPDGKGPVIISNDAPVINALNRGTSDKAPTGFIEAAIARGVNKTNR